ncbi:MAG: hypothetical protein EX271_07280 [Acidimicrobiales bacterium]|nr:hypothetical protein [Hyphomonadaceae bacterium]RZV41792.1 MAG: hypothetical protein EX271_07280 [Acidimicrobiales bacterium]
MGISKVCLGAASLVLALTFAAPAAAESTIKNAEDCSFEGGTMVNVKNSDYCLVQIRPEEYSGAEYDGNQLGIVECPGDKLNDGLFCMYPVTIRPQPVKAAPAVETVPAVETTPASDVKDAVVDAVKEKAEDMATDKAEDAVKSMVEDK